MAASQSGPRRAVIRWSTLRGSVSLIAFLAVAVLAEFLVVLYAMDLGVQDTAVLKVEWPLTISVSLLFNVVPATVIVTLLFSWMYLTKELSVRPLQPTGKTQTYAGRRQETKQLGSKQVQTSKSALGRMKQTFSKFRGFSYVWRKIRHPRATIKSAVTVFVAFLALLLIVSLLVYPMVVYSTISSSYQDRSPLYGFLVAVADWLGGFARAVSPIGSVAAAVNSILLAIAPGVRGIGLGLGSLIEPLTSLDPPGKYLVFQNASAWISALMILLYGRYARKGFRYRKR